MFTKPASEDLGAENISVSQPAIRTHEVIPEELIRARLEQSEEMREFYIQMWLQNPELAKQGGAKVQSLLTRLEVEDVAITQALHVPVCSQDEKTEVAE
ncbi:MAG: hypothetical protein WCI39_01500 [Gallionellaceae bacterium]